MARCSRCNRDVVSAQYGSTTVLLDAIPATYAAVESASLYASDGDRVYRSTALVEHSAVCEAERRDREKQQQAYRNRQAKQKQDA